jgi:hypothetical protein
MRAVAARERARQLSNCDTTLGEVEEIEVDRLQRTLALLIPGLVEVSQSPERAIIQ